MPLMRLVVYFDGRIMSTVTASSPSFSSAHPVPHALFTVFMPFTIYAFYTISYLVVLIWFLFNLSHVLLTLCVRTHPNFTTTASSSPHFPPPVFPYNRHSAGIRILVKNINIWVYSRRSLLCCNSEWQKQSVLTDLISGAKTENKEKSGTFSHQVAK